jgi:hypothetical protein
MTKSPKSLPTGNSRFLNFPNQSIGGEADQTKSRESKGGGGGMFEHRKMEGFLIEFQEGYHGSSSSPSSFSFSTFQHPPAKTKGPREGNQRPAGCLVFPISL